MPHELTKSTRRGVGVTEQREPVLWKLVGHTPLGPTTALAFPILGRVVNKQYGGAGLAAYSISALEPGSRSVRAVFLAFGAPVEGMSANARHK